MRIKNQDDILNPVIRKQIIEEIEGAENKERKDQAYKRYECYKDMVKKYVLERLGDQFDSDTVKEMGYAISNIAFVRKVIDKLARVYKYGVDREVWLDSEMSEEGTDALKRIADETDADRKFKKANRYFKLFKNTLMYIRPKPASAEGDKKIIKLDPLPPYLYDVVEMSDEREKAMCIILSDYTPSSRSGTPTPGLAVRPGTDGRNGNTLSILRHQGDGIDQLIADRKEDEVSGQYVFWSDNYHFTCNRQGEITSVDQDGNVTDANEIGAMPFVNYSEDQDGHFWAEGGDDLVDGSVLVNSMISNVNHIAITQGYGQPYMSGKEQPQAVKLGPNKLIFQHQAEGDPAPTFGFVNSNPPLDQLRSLVEMYVALMLTTNNLSTSGVQSNLNGAATFPSGIAMMIDKAESMEDVEDQRQVFIDNEPLVWSIYSKWYNLLDARDELPDFISGLDLPEEFDLRLHFGQPKAIETEMERLNALKLKKDLGLISMAEMIKEQFPTLSDDEAEEKLKTILEEKMNRASMFMSGGNSANNNQEQQDDEQRDERDDRPGNEEPAGVSEE